jgi:hypothetical protein
MPGGGTVQEKRVIEIGISRNAVPFGQLTPLELVRDLPDVPVLSETLLLMELKVRDRAVDLGEISQLVRGDLGAVIQIMRLAAREDASAECRPTRIEDCISGLGLLACVEAMSKQTVKRRNRPPAIVEAWTHAQVIAQYCRLLAEENRVSANPDEAFLVGLLHGIGSLPDVLGWDWTNQLFGDPELAGLKMAEAWSLPACVVGYFSELRPLPKPNRWTEIVERAHLQASLHVEDRATEGHTPLEKPSPAWMQLVSL